MISDRDVWAAALAIVKRYKEDAMLEAAERADQMLERLYSGLGVLHSVDATLPLPDFDGGDATCRGK
jgi:hypothetical protein